MRILYHHRTRADDAQGIHIAALCGALRELGHQVDIVALVRQTRVRAGPEPDAVEPGREGASLFGLPVPAWFYELLALAYNIPGFFMLTASVLRRRPDLIYERYALFTLCGRWVARLFALPFVLEVNAPLSLELSRHGGLAFAGLARRLETWLLSSSTRTVVVSQAMADLFVRQGVPAGNLVVMHNGVDAGRFNPQVDGGAVRARLGLEDSCVVGFVGWMRPWHGVQQLIDAVAELRPVCPGLRLLLVGGGPAVPGLREQVASLGMEHAVVFTGPLRATDVPAHVAAMDVVVQPDVTDYASPIKLFEYLAVGRAVLAPAKPNILEIVTDGQTALTFAAGDQAALTAALQRLYGDPALRTRLGAAGAALIDQRGYRWRCNARRVVDLVRPSPGAERA
ncbi:glycosyltransferase family 4 protein [Immundisolibacter sp.]|uniref:glycosyltransferase family 4 protein n=1 Tax=Immundisolibacter sp. TaxID=1934948 RepID=UPI003569F667